ncbi:hypothetical protein CTheo_6117 [Ceratobasidium theobromae]|uniref:Uncharacterized protein n=1 Tax=Ceratobasidium theobromae TaxID=1582974 RepID=A0A5N5QFL5_9AGAM|nr:hypothetical protein CTheo_6117 [Ceratobasidium theobromae]
MSSSRSSSLTRPEPPLTAWTSHTFSFPPCMSEPARLPTHTLPRARSADPHAKTSRVINPLPGFDDFAELVVSAERPIPRVTVTTPSDTGTCIQSWSKDDSDTGTVTFIFGRLRSVARCPPAPTHNSDPQSPHRVEFVRRISSRATTPNPQTPIQDFAA